MKTLTKSKTSAFLVLAVLLVVAVLLSGAGCSLTPEQRQNIVVNTHLTADGMTVRDHTYHDRKREITVICTEKWLVVEETDQTGKIPDALKGGFWSDGGCVVKDQTGKIIRKIDSFE